MVAHCFWSIYLLNGFVCFDCGIESSRFNSVCLVCIIEWFRIQEGKSQRVVCCATQSTRRARTLCVIMCSRWFKYRFECWWWCEFRLNVNCIFDLALYQLNSRRFVSARTLSSTHDSHPLFRWIRKRWIIF